MTMPSPVGGSCIGLCSSSSCSRPSRFHYAAVPVHQSRGLCIRVVQSGRLARLKLRGSIRLDRVLTHDEAGEIGDGFFEAVEELERMVREPSDVLGDMVERLSAREFQLVLVYFAQEGRDAYCALEVFDWLRRENRVDGETMELMVSIACGWIERLIGEDRAVEDVVGLLNEIDCVGLEPSFSMVEKVISLYWDSGKEEEAVEFVKDVLRRGGIGNPVTGKDGRGGLVGYLAWKMMGTGARSVTMGNFTAAQVLGEGRIDLKLTSGKLLNLYGVQHVPDVRRNLISGSLLVQLGFKLIFESNKFVITRNGNFVGKGYMSDGLFVLNVLGSSYSNKSFSSVVFHVESCDVWHARLGHVNLNTMKRMMHLNLIPKFDVKYKDKCQICVQAKLPRKPFKSIERNTSVLELVHSDIYEGTGSLTRGGKRYFITFIDDASRFCLLYLMNTKDQTLDKIMAYKSIAEKQTDMVLKRIRSDRGGEYTSNAFHEFCEKNGIIHELTAPYSPESNGVAERKNRTLIDMVNSMLCSSGLPENMWGEALLSACYVLNCVHQKISHLLSYGLKESQIIVS